MIGLIVRMLVIAAGLAVAAWIVSGIGVDSPAPVLLRGFVMGRVNAILRPIIILLPLPLTIVTFGLFLLVVNAGMFALVAWLLDGFTVSGFFAALFGWLIVSIVSWLASWYIGPKGRYQVIVIERR